LPGRVTAFAFKIDFLRLLVVAESVDGVLLRTWSR
jgi:hypothetical protein